MTTPAAPPAIKAAKFHKWHRVVLSICFIAFAGELGLCLLVLPWLSNWGMSYIPIHIAKLSDIWMSPYFRGLLSGIGLLNIYIALAEASRELRGWFTR